MNRSLAALIIGIVSATFAAQSPAQTPTAARQQPVATKMVDVAGIATRYHVSGLEKRAAGTPVLVFMNGHFAQLEVWSGVLDRLDARIPRLAYDRPGAGKSSVFAGKLTPERANAHLAELLKQLNIAPPFVLVSWSWGGPLALDFASRNLGAVVGNVFLDPTLVGVGPAVDRERLIRLGAKPEDVDAADALGEKEMSEMLAQLPPGARSELEVITEIADVLNPPYPLVATSILLADKYVPGFTRGSLPSGVDEEKYFRAERAFARRTLEARLKGVPSAVLRMLPLSSHKVPADAPEAVVEEIRRVLGSTNWPPTSDPLKN
jgi:pimeloyl-ACP methyl ester carboxylesterase